MEAILAVDDEPDVLALISKVLRLSGFEVASAPNGQVALEMLQEDAYDLVLLDIMMPRLGGTALLEEMRRLEMDTPVIFLTAKDALPSKVQGLNLGADDYITKPFDIEELVARIRTVLRRTKSVEPPPNAEQPAISAGHGGAAHKGDVIIEFNDLRIDTNSMDVFRNGHIVNLTPTEYQILEHLAKHRGQIVFKTVLAEIVGAKSSSSSLLDTHISSLRQKLNACGENIIITKRSVGYLIR
jgi:two-component system OmpR family response regulator